MGHWSVFCAVTKTPITCDRCVAVWAKDGEYRDIYSGGLINSIFYRGEYDTYGRLEFDTGQKYHDHLSGDDLNQPSMFLSETVYDEILKFSIGKHGGITDGSTYSNGDISAHNLKILGFVESDKKSKDERYNRVFTHESEPNKKIHSDGTWIRLYVGKKETSVYDFSGVEKYFPNIDYTILKNKMWELDLIDIYYFEYKRVKDLFESLGDTYDTSFVLESSLGITKDLLPYMEDENFRQELAKTLRIKQFLRANNIEFGYRFAYGPQDGNYEAHEKLFELIKMEHGKNLEMRKEWDDD